MTGTDDTVVWIFSPCLSKSGLDLISRVIPARKKASMYRTATASTEWNKFDVEVAHPVVERRAAPVGQDDKLVSVIDSNKAGGIRVTETKRALAAFDV